MSRTPLQNTRLLVAGAGDMGRAHIAALAGLGVTSLAAFAPSQRSEAAVRDLGAEFFVGSLSSAIAAFSPTHVVIAVPVEHLVSSAVEAIKAGAADLLLEKPGALTPADGARLSAAAGKAQARVVVGYNRRYYGSVDKALRLIAEAGEPVTSVVFEFTEWSDVIAALTNQAAETKARWVLANSMHVIDGAFLPVGLPDEARSQFVAAGRLAWHPTAQFAGSGVTKTGVPFSYSANWDTPGRWGFEWLTHSRRYVFRPMEKLQVIERGSVSINEVPLDDDLDQRFKPGLYRQHRAWLTGFENSRLCDLDFALKLVRLGERIGGYEDGTTG